MQEIIVSIMNQWGYFGVALLIAVENIFPPIPSEVILTFGGFMTTQTSLHVAGMILASTIGAVVGALVLYGIGAILDEEKIEKIVSGKVGKVLRLKMKDIRKAEQWFQTKGIFTVFFCRFVPIVRSLISIPAGISRMKLVPFVLFTTLGSLIWNTILICLGRAFGDHWETIVAYVSMYSKVGAIVLGILLIGFCCWYYQKKMKKKTKRD